MAYKKIAQESLAPKGVLTYMSMGEEWVKRIAEKKLFKLEFAIPGPKEMRTVFLSQELNDLVCGAWSDTSIGIRCARLRADLENILEGERLTVCWFPFKARDHHQIGRLDPVEDNIFDIRSADPRPGLRVIFHFAEKDVLVAHICSPRSVQVSWLHRLPLGSKTSKEWKGAIAEAKQQWSMLFPGHAPHNGTDVNEYLSNAVVI